MYDALLIQSGVQRVDTIAELFDYAALYTTQPLPRGNRVAIITNAGGPGIMATDAAVRHGLKLAELSEATKDKLRAALPPTASLRNPVDVIGDARADRYKAAVRTVLEDENVDMGIVILTPQSMTDIEETAAVVPEAVKGIDKPVVCSFMGASDVAPGVAILREAGVPNYRLPRGRREEPGRRQPVGHACTKFPAARCPSSTDLRRRRGPQDHRRGAGRQDGALSHPGRVPAAAGVLQPAAVEERRRPHAPTRRPGWPSRSARRW